MIRNAIVAAILTVASVGLLGRSRPFPIRPNAPPSGRDVHAMADMPGMASTLHMNMTDLRPETPEDAKRAKEVVEALRSAIEKYRDYRLAVRDGYRPFLPSIKQPTYHFTNYWHAFNAAFTFNPAEPTSLLYKKTADGYQLIGAMYTAPKRFSESQLNQRVPLSVARWHQHVNICLPQKGQGRMADWTKFGFAGSIARQGACEAAGGRWYPVIFGWMVHVYPFEADPPKIWAH